MERNWAEIEAKAIRKASKKAPGPSTGPSTSGPSTPEPSTSSVPAQEKKSPTRAEKSDSTELEDALAVISCSIILSDRVTFLILVSDASSESEDEVPPETEVKMCTVATKTRYTGQFIQKINLAFFGLLLKVP